MYDSTPCDTKQRVLVTMAIELTLEGAVFDQGAIEDKQLLPQKRKKSWKPTVKSLQEEMERRKEELGIGGSLRRIKSSGLRYQWLVDNLIVDQGDIRIIGLNEIKKEFGSSRKRERSKMERNCPLFKICLLSSYIRFFKESYMQNKDTIGW